MGAVEEKVGLSWGSSVELPLWFLIVSVALPRTCLIAAYLWQQLLECVLNGWVSPSLCIFIPRLVIIILIFQNRGMSPWLLLHGIAIAVAYSEGGSQAKNRIVYLPASEPVDRNKRLYL